MTFAFNWGNCLNEVIRAHCCSPGPWGIVSFEITVHVFGLRLSVCTLLLWANVILTEMSAFLRTCVSNLGCACAWTLGDKAVCSVSALPVVLVCGNVVWLICLCKCLRVCVWSSHALVRLEASVVLNRYNSSFSRSLSPSSFLTALTFSGQKHSLSLPGCHLSVLLNNPFYRSCSTPLSLPHFNLLFSRLLHIKWFRVLFLLL